jgi:hypothetical protein
VSELHISLSFTYINVSRKYSVLLWTTHFVHSIFFMLRHIVFTVCFPHRRIRTCTLQNIYCQFEQITLKIAIYRIYMSMTALQLGIGGRTIKRLLKCHHFGGLFIFWATVQNSWLKCNGHIVQ